MKKTLLTLFVLFTTIATFAQSPELINYQAVVTNADGNLVSEAAIGMQISILQTTADGTAVYTETHTTTTNTSGLISIMIGGGTSTDDFAAIDWSAGPYFIKTEIDAAGGTNYTLMGTSQLLSVPYALYAKNGSKFTETNEGLEYGGGNITLTQPGATIKLTAPDGTEYELGVNENGQLSLPTSNASATTPTQLYMYGSFNNWDAANALRFGYGFPVFTQGYIGIKYFTAGTEFKILAAQNESIVYGAQGLTNGSLVLNGASFIIPSNGLYRIKITPNGNQLDYEIESINVSFSNNTLLYNPTNDSFYTTLSTFGNGSVGTFFNIGGSVFADNLADLSIDYQGEYITRLGTHTFVELFLNFNTSGTYTLN